MYHVYVIMYANKDDDDYYNTALKELLITIHTPPHPLTHPS